MNLVTGGTGFIGSHLVERLASQGEPVRALVRKATRFGNKSIEIVRGNLATGEGLPDALKNVDTVFHLAGVTKALSIADYYTGNVRATENLARAIAATGRPIRTVHVSSLAVMGPGPDLTPLAEDAEPHPLTHYGKSKLEGERVIRAILPDAVIVRPPAVYGPRDTDVFEVLKSIDRGMVMEIAGGERWFSAIYVSDLVDGIVAAARAPRATDRTYFLARQEIVSWSELIGLASRIMGRKPRIVRVPPSVAYAIGYGAELWSRLTRKPGIVSRDKVTEMQGRYWICDTSRAKAEIGFEAPTDIETGLAITLAWYREAGWLKWAGR
jgi:nucleoside-diphosphate-sugar epimerase